MIVLYILLGILALIVVLLHFSVTAQIALEKNKLTNLQVKWLFFTLYPRPKKEKKKKRAKKQKRVKKSVSEEKPEKKETEDLPEEFAASVELPPEHEKTEPTPELTIKQRKALAKKEKELAKEKKKLEQAQKKRDKKHASEKKSGGKLDELKRKWAMIKPYVPTAWRFVRRMMKTIRMTQVKITLRAGKEDAYEAAVQYGKFNGILFGALSALSGIFTLKVRRAQVECVFHEKVMEADVSAVVKIRPSAIIAIVFCTAIKALGIFLRGWFVKRRERRARRKLQRKKQRMSAVPEPQA